MGFDDRNLYGRAIDPEKRGRHDVFSSALGAAFQDLVTEKNPFFDSLVESWRSLFPGLAARPGRYADGKIFLYVRSAPASFAIRPRLRAIAARLAALPGAPKKVDLRLEIHA